MRTVVGGPIVGGLSLRDGDRPWSEEIRRLTVGQKAARDDGEAHPAGPRHPVENASEAGVGVDSLLSSPREFEQPAVFDAARACRLARPAPEARIEGLASKSPSDPALLRAASEIDAAARRQRFQPGLDGGRAGFEAEPAPDAPGRQIDELRRHPGTPG